MGTWCNNLRNFKDQMASAENNVKKRIIRIIIEIIVIITKIFRSFKSFRGKQWIIVTIARINRLERYLIRNLSKIFKIRKCGDR